MTILYTANCNVCNPVDITEPVVYDDPEKRDWQARAHADKTGHSVQVGFMFT